MGWWSYGATKDVGGIMVYEVEKIWVNPHNLSDPRFIHRCYI